jgi:hypothetical protein
MLGLRRIFNAEAQRGKDAEKIEKTLCGFASLCHCVEKQKRKT